MSYYSWPADLPRTIYDNTIPKISTLRLIPRVQWSCSENRKDPLRIMENTRTIWDYKQDSLNQMKSLPPGWTRHRTLVSYESKQSLAFFEVNDPYDDYDGKHITYYTHVSNSRIQYWYPIPIRDKQIQPYRRPLEAYLHCTTKRAFLDAYHIGSSCWNLRTKAGKFAGALTYNGLDHQCETLSNSNPEVSCQSVCELILVSEGFASNKYNRESLHIEGWNDP